jgi:hypothetical protein
MRSDRGGGVVFTAYVDQGRGGYAILGSLQSSAGRPSASPQNHNLVMCRGNENAREHKIYEEQEGLAYFARVEINFGVVH